MIYIEMTFCCFLSVRSEEFAWLEKIPACVGMRELFIACAI